MNGAVRDQSYGFTLSQDWQIIAVQDLNADDRDDLIARHTDGRFVTITMADGTAPEINLVGSLGSEWTLV
jgi:hypothetical protein